ncbi:hypothetical protein [Desulfobulbus elongatus]|uniref:hypothetical protein n=1 Tax=Desulfobulbus elongatus TaxID=53332 RepID=UPI0012F84ED4|nr:hypothetical protein [Desulfobulbus elongatus]
MNILLIIFSILPFFLCVSCSESQDARLQKQRFSISSEGDPELIARGKAVAPKIIQSCPKLNEYATDLSAAKVSLGRSLDNEYDGGLEIAFKVSDKPNSLPKPLNLFSKGHNCSIFLNREQNKMYIAKRACHSLCDGVWKDNDHESLGKTFALK